MSSIVKNIKFKKKKQFLGKIGTKKHRIFDTRKHALRKYMEAKFPVLYFILFRAKENELMATRRLYSFPIGLTIGLLLHKVVISRFYFEPELDSLMLTLVTLITGIWYTLSVQVRVICWLLIPTFFGKISRNYIITLTFAAVVGGPIANLAYNAYDSARVIGCTFALNWNHTSAKMRLIFMPIKNIIIGMGKDSIHITKKASQIKEKFLPFEKEVEDESEEKDEVKNIEEIDEFLDKDSRVEKVEKTFQNLLGSGKPKSQAVYSRKIEYRCENVFSLGVKGCELMFKNAEKSCYDKLKVLGYLLCWPLKLTFLCNVAVDIAGGRTCDSMPVMSPNFGEGFEAAEESVREFKENFRAQLQYKLVLPDEPLEMTTPEEIKKTLKRTFERKSKYFVWANEMLQRMLVLIFVFVFYKARQYNHFYLRKIYFDNIYITAYFRHIDARRKLSDKMYLLPLKRMERMEFIDSLDIRLTPEEKRKHKSIVLTILSIAFAAAIIIYMDYIFAVMLIIFRKNAFIEYDQRGVHDIKMTVYGNGSMAKMVRNIIKDFSHHEKLEIVTSTEKCLPQPKLTDWDTIYFVYGLFLLCIVLNYMEAYFLRFRRLVCGFFYPRREKQRILYLYNDRLKKRKNYLRYLVHRTRKLVKEKSLSVDPGLLVSAARHSSYFRFLRRFACAKRSCIVCDEKEDQTFVECSNTDCDLIYCEQCWKEVNQKCYGCIPIEDDDTDLSDDDV